MLKRRKAILMIDICGGTFNVQERFALCKNKVPVQMDSEGRRGCVAVLLVGAPRCPFLCRVLDGTLYCSCSVALRCPCVAESIAGTGAQRRAAWLQLAGVFHSSQIVPYFACLFRVLRGNQLSAASSTPDSCTLVSACSAGIMVRLSRMFEV